MAADLEDEEKSDKLKNAVISRSWGQTWLVDSKEVN